jgi:CRISPR-associated endonuclease Csy4
MDHYQEIILLPDPEFAPQVLMNALFSKLHRALAALGSGSIGVSFPGHSSERRWLGDRLRIHGTNANLERLGELGWLKGIHDHAEVRSIRSVPQNGRHVMVRRVQAKSNPDRQRRRLAKRKGISLEEAGKLIPDQSAQRLDLPFVTMRSSSSGHTFRLVHQAERAAANLSPGAGAVSVSTASAPTATVPWI